MSTAMKVLVILSTGQVMNALPTTVKIASQEKQTANFAPN